MFFSPAGRLAQSQLSGVCTILCMPMLGSFCCSQSHCLRQVLTEPGTYYFCYTGWPVSPTCLHPTALRLQIYTCWVSAASALSTESIPQSLCLSPDILYLHHTPRGFYSTVSGPQQRFVLFCFYSKTFISACRPLRVPKTLNLQRSKLLL